MNKVLLDTNSLILWVTGNCDISKIGHHKRLSSFSTEQFDWLSEALSKYSRHTTLPNIITEASNLIIQDSGSIFRNGAEFLAAYASEVLEKYIPTADTIAGRRFVQYGSTDAAIFLYATEHKVAVITGDHALYGMLSEKKVECFNIWHMLSPKI